MTKTLTPLCLVLGLFFATWANAQDKPAEKQDAAPEIAKLIEQLGSDDFTKRDAASRKLAEIGETARSQLEKAMASADREVQRRAKRLLEALDVKAEEKKIASIFSDVNKVGLDLFMDETVRRKELQTPERLTALVKTAQALVAHARVVSDQPFAAPDLDPNQLTIATAGEVGGFDKTALLVNGYDKLMNVFFDSLLVSGGSLEAINGARRSILFINGDLKFINNTEHCVIVTTGNIKGFNKVTNSIVLILGECQSADLRRGNFYQVAQGIRWIGQPNAVYLKGMSGPLEAIRFFKPDQLGIEVSLEREAVRIDKVKNLSILAKAGLQPDDVVLKLNGMKFGGIEEFRVLLRQRTAEGDAVFEIKRSDKVMEVKASLRE
jgi:hypothetical protein